MYNLFGYSRDPARRIVRFSLDANLQTTLTEYLKSQVAAFDNDCEEIPFDGKYKPDHGEMLVIEDFDDLDNLANAIKSPLDIPLANPSDFDFDAIKALFFGETEADGIESVYLQSFDRRRVITDQGFSIFHSQGVYKRIEGTGLTIDTKISAKLKGKKLKFVSFFYARQIFDMSTYYQEATDADIKDFAEIPMIHVANLQSLIDMSDTWIRNKLWLVRESKILERIASAEIRAVAAEFNIHVTYETLGGAEVLVIPEDKKELKTLLRFLDEDYYKSPLSKTSYLSNSKRPIG